MSSRKASKATAPGFPYPPQQIEAWGIEPVEGWWTGNSQFGRRFTGDMPASLVNANPIDLLDLPHAPGPPRTLSVQLYRSDKQIGTFGNCDVQCQVTYGAGGTANTFLCDWSSGSGFTIVANTVRLAIVPVIAAQVGNPYSPLTGLVLGATIGLGSLPQSSCFFTSAPLRTIPNLTSMQAPVPDFATGFQLICVDHGGANSAIDLTKILIEFRAADNTSLDRHLASEVAGDLFSVEGLRVPGRALFVSVFNNTGAAVDMSPQWALGL